MCQGFFFFGVLDECFLSNLPLTQLLAHKGPTRGSKVRFVCSQCTALHASVFDDVHAEALA